MDDTAIQFPLKFRQIEQATRKLGFDQISETLLGSLLSTVAASKPHGNFLELGTGSGLSTSWILQGMDKNSKLKTIDNDENLVAIAKKYLEQDNRVEFKLGQGEHSYSIQSQIQSILSLQTRGLEYTHLEETLLLLKQGGIYLIDDMLPQENWPEGHHEKVNILIQYLENRNDIILTKLCWSTGIIICTKRVSTPPPPY